MRRRSSAAARGAAAPGQAVLGPTIGGSGKFLCAVIGLQWAAFGTAPGPTLALMRPCVGVRFSDAAIVTVSSRDTDQMKRPHRLAGDRASICSGDCETSRGAADIRRTLDGAPMC